MPPQIQNIPAPRALYFSPAECLGYYKKAYQFREIQIHWWDSPSANPSHDGVVAYALRRTEGSVNYVASAGRVTKMVEEDQCALTTQGGNPYGIKIECSPYGTDGDYETIAWLVADIWRRRGYLPLVPHNKYWNTTCPGTIDLARIERQAKSILGGKGGGEMSKDALTKEEVIEEHRAYFFSTPGANYDYHHVGGPLQQLIQDWAYSDTRKAIEARYFAYDTLTQQVTDLRKQAEDLAKNPSQEAYDKLAESLKACEVQAKQLQDEKATDEKTGNAFLRFLAGLFRKSSS